MAIAEDRSNDSNGGRVQEEALELMAVVDPVPTLTAYISFYPHSHCNGVPLLPFNGFQWAAFKSTWLLLFLPGLGRAACLGSRGS